MKDVQVDEHGNGHLMEEREPDHLARPAPARLPAKRQQAKPLAVIPTSPAEMLGLAVQNGASLEQIDKLMGLMERHEANEARKAFADDMVRFKAKPLEIVKDRQVGYTSKDGDFVSYWHATIGNVVEVVVPALAEFGFSHRWDTDQRDGLVIVTCVITHRLGHSQSTTLMASPDQSGKKNPIQSIISAKTYLERHTLLAATGLATKDSPDDDGEASGIRQEERAELRQAGRDMRSNRNPRPADVAAQRQQAPKEADPALLADARAAADHGRAAFETFWKGINGEKRTALGLHLDDLQQRCDTADKKQGEKK